MPINNIKCRICRRAGKKLFLKAGRCDTSKCALVKRNYAPGIHGQRTAGGRLSDYGRQLKEKQSAKYTYNLSEKQFKGYFERAFNQKDETGTIFYILLELRLDNVIKRLGWGKSVQDARQLVNHGHFLVNGKKVNIPSYRLKINDVVSIREKSLKNKAFEDLAERLKNHEISEWLHFDQKEMTGKVLELPDIKKVALGFDMKSIIEYYSR